MYENVYFGLLSFPPGQLMVTGPWILATVPQVANRLTLTQPSPRS